MIESKQPGYAIMFSTDHQRKSESRTNSRASQAKRKVFFFHDLVNWKEHIIHYTYSYRT